MYEEPTLKESATLPEPPAVVVDYPARDMTITVGAGLRIGELQQILQKENQQLPLDVADDEMLLGQFVAEDISGPRQFGYGTLRDYVIGIEAVDGQGRVFHAGGRVVKNVAGYDLCRLLIGSRGQLGTITQLTFKLKPLPEQQTLAVAGFRSLRDLDSALERLNLTATTPVILDVITRPVVASMLGSAVPELVSTLRGADAAAVLILGFEGTRVSCEWQISALKDELDGTATWTHIAEKSDASENYCRSAQKASCPTPDDKWVARFLTLPSRVVSAITVVQQERCSVFGRAGNGTLFVRPLPENDGDPVGIDESKALDHLQSLVSGGVGSVELLKSTAGRSSASPAGVQVISRKLRELLGQRE